MTRDECLTEMEGQSQENCLKICTVAIQLGVNNLAAIVEKLEKIADRVNTLDLTTRDVVSALREIASSKF